MGDDSWPLPSNGSTSYNIIPLGKYTDRETGGVGSFGESDKNINNYFVLK
jgi:hypothetical protein